MASSVALLGCGRLGNILGVELLKQGFKVYGIRRQVDRIAKGIQPIAADLGQSGNETQSPDLQKLLDEGSDFLVIALAPKQRNPEAYRFCYELTPQAFVSGLSNQARKRLKRIFFISSTAVFSNDNVEVTEKSAINPQEWNGKILQSAEQLLMKSFPTTVINASGIYGNLRWGLLDSLAKPEKLNVLYDKVSNGIHETDLANFIVHLINNQPEAKLANRYIATDNKSYRFSKIVKFLSAQSEKHARALKVVEDSNSWKRFTKSKVCLNQKMQQTGFKLSYPTRYEGYAETITMWSRFQLLTEFQRRVLSEVTKIPWGKTCSYKDLGNRVGCRCYRVVGQVLRINPCAPLIPCHRVVRSDGSIGGFEGNKAGDSILKKKRLLANEGVYLS